MRGLAISTLSLSHFRSHQRAEVEFDGRPVAIVGPNGAGKTNILEAVSLLSPGRGLRRATSDEIARRPQSIGWKVSARLTGFSADHEVQTWAEGKASRQVRIDGKTASQIALGRLTRVLWLVPAMDRLWIEAAEGRRRFLDRMALSFFPDHAQAALDYEKSMRERNRLLKDAIQDPRWYEALEARMAEAGTLLTQNREATIARLSRAQEEAQSLFPRADLNLIQEGGPDLAEEFAKGRARDMAAGRTLVGPHRADLGAIYTAKGAQAGQCSTGEQKALLLSLILANARALAADLGRAPILLLDEVAAHLDPNRRAALYDEIEALGAHALMTGTEEALFDSLGARAQRITLSEIEGSSHISR